MSFPTKIIYIRRNCNRNEWKELNQIKLNDIDGFVIYTRQSWNQKG